MMLSITFDREVNVIDNTNNCHLSVLRRRNEMFTSMLNQERAGCICEMSRLIRALRRNAMLATVLCLAGAATPTFAQAVYPAPGQRTGPGVLPPAVSSVTYPGDIVDPAYN